MEIIALVGKGGTAKTTSTASLGHAFARRRLRTVIVDLDSQASLSDWLVGERDGHPMVEDVLMGRATWADALVEVSPNLWLAPTQNFALREVDEHIGGLKRQSELVITKALAGVEIAGAAPDVVLLDTPRGLDTNIAMNIFEAMTHALIASEPSPMSVAAFREIALAVQDFEEGRGRRLLLGVLPTRYVHTTMSKISVETLAENEGLRLLTPIRATTKAAESVAVDELLWDYDPTCTAALDYEKAAEEVMEVLGLRSGAVAGAAR